MTDSILISGGRLIDGTGAPPLEKSIINIQGGRIEKVGVSGQVQIPSNVPVIDASGMTVIPGLIDAHVHITGPYDPNETNIVLSILKTPPPLSALWAVRNANVCLEAGYTTLRDLGVFLTRDNIEMVSVRRGIDLGLVDGPRLVVAGIVVQTSSHPELAALGRISPLVYTNYGTSDGPWEVRKRVRHLVGLDVDWIKVMASGWGERWRNTGGPTSPLKNSQPYAMKRTDIANASLLIQHLLQPCLMLPVRVVIRLNIWSISMIRQSRQFWSVTLHLFPPYLYFPTRL